MKAVKPFSLIVMLALTGCSSPQPYRYYTLQSHAPVIGSGVVGSGIVGSGIVDSIKGSVGIAPVKIPAWMDRTSLTYSDGAFQLHMAAQDRWGEPLGDAVTRVVTQNLQRLNPQADIFHGPWVRSQRPEREIDLEIQNLTLNNHQLELEISWRIDGIRQISRYHAGVTESPAAVEIAKVFSDLLGQLSGDLQQYLLKLPDNRSDR